MTLSVFTNFQVDTITGIRIADFAKEAFQKGTENLGGVPQGPGGTSYLTGYSEAISCKDGDVRLGQFGDEVDALTVGGKEGEKLASKKWDPAPACSIGETCTPTCDTGFADDALVQKLDATVPYELRAGMGISANARGKTTGTIAALQIEPEAGDVLIPDEFPGADSLTTSAGGESFNCDDITLGQGTTYQLKDVIITSFDNADAQTNGGTDGYTEVEWPYLTTGGSTPLQENCANGTFLNGEQQGYIEMDLPGVLPNLGISNACSLDANEEAFFGISQEPKPEMSHLWGF